MFIIGFMCKITLLTLGTSFHCAKCTLDSWIKKKERKDLIFSTHGNVTVAGINILNFIYERPRSKGMQVLKIQS